MSDLYDEFESSPEFAQEALDWVLSPEGRGAFMRTDRGQRCWHHYQCDTAADDAIERVRRNANEDLPL